MVFMRRGADLHFLPGFFLLLSSSPEIVDHADAFALGNRIVFIHVVRPRLIPEFAKHQHPTLDTGKRRLPRVSRSNTHTLRVHL